MKTAREMAKEWLIKNIGVADLDEIDGLETLINSIQIETRQACANATICYPAHTTAYDACMNVKAV